MKQSYIRLRYKSFGFITTSLRKESRSIRMLQLLDLTKNLEIVKFLYYLHKKNQILLHILFIFLGFFIFFI
uniref:Putative ovule protein n=1 Tax=Solanum chacoense TaxID=4108 RepID=A0A0V0HM55_SOLCH